MAAVVRHESDGPTRGGASAPIPPLVRRAPTLFLASIVTVAGAFAGTPAAAQTTTATPVTPKIVINEVLADPVQVYDSRGEWIELHNAGTTAVDLAGWTIGDEVFDQVTLPSLVVEPGAQVVLGRDADAYANGGAPLAHVYGNEIVLANEADSLILRNPSEVEVDRAAWDASTRPPAGASWSRRDASLPGAAAASWCAAVTVMARGDLGTPGSANRCEPSPHHLVITEILQNPAAVADAQGEWFEVHNPGDQPVDMAGWTVKDDDEDRFTIDAPLVVPAQGYAVLARQGSANGGVIADYVYGDVIALHNDTDELVLADADLAQVDRVQWDNGATFPDPDGASMALADPASDNALGASWCASTRPWAVGDRGTPGTPSWCLAAGQAPIVITEVMADPETPPGERAAEWFEITNLGDAPVDLAGWTITAGDLKTHTITSLLVAPGEIVVLGASADLELNGGAPVGYAYGTDLPLFNAAGRVVLTSADGDVIDRVDWSAPAGFPIVPGRSLSLRSPAADGTLGANWCASPLPFGAGDFGSPASTNSCALPPAPPAVSISEVLRNPAVVDDTFGEWFEVHNASDAPVDLRGWVLSDGASDRHVVRTSVLVPAGGYAVLGRTADRTVNGDVALDYAHGDGFVLTNDADAIVLHDQYGQLVDQTAWQLTDSPRPNGASIARLGTSWCESGPQFGRGDRGTPGAANDCTPRPHANVVINEIHVDPAALSDTVGEWVELLNAGSTSVDVNGWVLRDDDFDAHTIDAGGPLVIAPGGTLVLGRDVAAINGGAPVQYVYGSALPLVEPADEINLYDAALVPVDRVAWSSARPLPYATGASASLRSPTLDGGDPASWCTSVTTYGVLGEKGTPGAPNTCVVVTPPPMPTYSILALSTGSWCKGLDVSGSTVTVNGNVRSNSSVSMSGSSVKVNGNISYGTSKKISSKVVHGGLLYDRTPVAANLPWAVADFAPGGRLADQPAYRSYTRSIDVGRSGLAPGVHYVKGNVTISGSAPDLPGVTIVATGRIKISGGSDLSPASPALPTLLAGTSLEISGSSVTWTGLIAAPTSEVKLSGSRITGERLVGAFVRLSGSKIVIGPAAPTS